MKYHIYTYGCQMNVHESEKLAGMLENLGYVQTDTVDESDVIVFNTCCIRDTAETKIMGNIGAVKPLKRANKKLKIIVCGCMTQQDMRAAELKQKFPFIDIVLGTHNIDRLPQLLKEEKHAVEIRKEFSPFAPQSVTSKCLQTIDGLPVHRTSFPNAWVNIAYGCNNFCTYCIVPYVRGRERSRPKSVVLDEVNRLLDDGYREITLLGQNVNSYGRGLEDNTNFCDLLTDIAKINGKFRIRFMTSHPKDFNSDVVGIIADSPNICKHIHLPIQSGSNRVLEAMNRHYTREKYLSIVEDIRSHIPNAGITTDIIVGFPTETDEDFADTLDIVNRVGYSNAFTFIYSMRRGTPAASMEQIPYEIKRKRIGELIALQNKITKELSVGYLNKDYEVLVEDINPKVSGCVCGRTDCGRLVTMTGDESLIGKFVNVNITKAKSASLFGEIVK